MRDTPRLWCVFALVLLAGSVQAQDAPPKMVREYWDAAYLEGAKSGHFHTLIVETERDGKKLFITTHAISLKVKRGGETVEMKMEDGVEETPEGKVVSVSTTMYTGAAKLTVTGRVEGDKLVIRGAGGRELKRLTWDANALGPYAQDRVWKEKKLKPGARFEFTNFELDIEKAFKISISVKEMEETIVLEAKKADPKAKAEYVKRTLLRAEAVPDKVEVGGAILQLPKVVSWLDGDANIVRAETRLPGLGRIIAYRTTKAIATEEGAAPDTLPDLMLTTLIPINKPIDRPYERTEVVYRITMTDDDDPKSAFALSARQSIENVKGNVFELRVQAQRAFAQVERPEKVSDDYRGANHFLDSADETVKALAARAVGTEKEPWAKAKRIETWVHQNMKGTSTEVFPTASQIARNLKGDCRQHALLTAAMCRAVGLPSRTALGLVYTVDRQKGPVFAFHMWTEVYIVDQWMSLDATLGIGGVGPTHLKVGDQSWHDVQTMAPLLSVLRVLDKIKVEVVAVK